MSPGGVGEWQQEWLWMDAADRSSAGETDTVAALELDTPGHRRDTVAQVLCQLYASVVS